MSSNILNQFDSVLKCPICFEKYNFSNRSPISLNCKHLHCLDCSKKLLKNSQIECTICRTITNSDNINQLKKSYEQIFMEVLDVFQDQENKHKPQTPPDAQEEGNNKAAGYTKVIQDLSAINDLKKLIINIDNQTRVYNEVPIRIGFIGKSKVGKSTLINTLRGLSKSTKEDENSSELAKVDVVQCTKIVKGYKYNNDGKILLCDVPGVGTPEYSKNDEYLKKIEFNSYDFIVLLASDGFFESDAFILQNIFKAKKKFAFVYSKLDSIIRGELESLSDYDDLSEDEKSFQQMKIIDRLRSDCIENINKYVDDQEYKLFFISCLKKYNDLYDYKNFIEEIIMALPKKKMDAMMLASRTLTNTIIVQKTEQLRKRVEEWKESFNGIGILKFLTFKIYSVFRSYLHNLIVEEIKYYKQVFCINDNPLKIEYTQEIKNLIEKYDDIEKFIKTLVDEMPMEGNRFTINGEKLK